MKNKYIKVNVDGTEVFGFCVFSFRGLGATGFWYRIGMKIDKRFYDEEFFAVWNNKNNKDEIGFFTKAEDIEIISEEEYLAWKILKS